MNSYLSQGMGWGEREFEENFLEKLESWIPKKKEGISQAKEQKSVPNIRHPMYECSPSKTGQESLAHVRTKLNMS